MVIFTARQNLANLNEVKMNLIVKFANLAGKSYNKVNMMGIPCLKGKNDEVYIGCVYHHFLCAELRFPNDFQGDFWR